MVRKNSTPTASPYIVPLFIPHEGCPHRCVYCNQHAVAGARDRLTGAQAAALIASQLARPRDRQRPVQVAFYGGSFTALALGRQEELLMAVQPFLASGEVAAVRLSTRPDAVDGQTAGFLLARGVGVVELGVQSMNQPVLTASGRKYAEERVAAAFGLLRRGGLRVGGQLMLGLPGETTASQLAGLRRLLALQPEFLRLYPALVLEGSRLANLYRAGHYRPLSLARAVVLAARMKALCEAAGVEVVRMGLQPSAELEQQLVAGPYHPAFGELVLSRRLFTAARRQLAIHEGARRIKVSASDESIFRGPRNLNLRRLAALGLLRDRVFELCPDQPRQTIELE